MPLTVDPIRKGRSTEEVCALGRVDCN